MYYIIIIFYSSSSFITFLYLLLLLLLLLSHYLLLFYLLLLYYIGCCVFAFVRFLLRHTAKPSAFTIEPNSKGPIRVLLQRKLLIVHNQKLAEQ